MDLNKDYNRLLDPEDLTIDGDYLVFMDENQEVVSWGIAVDALGEEDPVVWQRNNTPPEAWFSEEMVFTKFIETMLYWLRHGELPEEGV